MKMQRSFSFIIAALIFAPMSYAEEAIEDIEAEMDTAFSDSDAARSEADAARQRKAEEKTNLIKAKQDARTQVQKAQITEVQARQKIADLEKQIAVMQKERAGHEAQIKKSLAQIKLNEQKVAAAVQRREKVMAEKDAAKEENAKQNALLVQKREELGHIETQIRAERDALNNATLQLKELKQKNATQAREVQKRRLEAVKESKRIDRQKASVDLPFRTIALKQDCSLHLEAKLDSKVLNRVKKSTRVSIVKYNSDGWFRVNANGSGFMHMSCR